jgi:hypothetical protein
MDTGTALSKPTSSTGVIQMNMGHQYICDLRWGEPMFKQLRL